jgi:hypothetical protein
VPFAPERNQENLIIQLTAPNGPNQYNKWSDGATLFTEVGPGKVFLLVIKIDKEAVTANA